MYDNGNTIIKRIGLDYYILGFSILNPRNWTYATPRIYLSDMRDENLIKSPQGNIFVIDCDIRINTPNLKCEGVRKRSNEVEFIM